MNHSVRRSSRFFSVQLGFLALALAAFGAAFAATAWRTETKESTLTFSGTQAGAPFTAAFERFTVQVSFDPKDLATSRFDVAVDVKSVNSKDQERDDTIRGGDFLDAARWPSARFVAEKFTDKGGGQFTGVGKLTLRDVTRDVPIDFTFTTEGTATWLKGRTVVKRLDFNVGQGDWKDTAWVGNDVTINFAIRLNKAG